MHTLFYLNPRLVLLLFLIGCVGTGSQPANSQISSPHAAFLPVLTTPPHILTQFAADQTTLYLGVDSTVQVVDIVDATRPALQSVVPLIHPVQELVPQGSLLYVATSDNAVGAGSLTIIDVQQRNRPQVLGQLALPPIRTMAVEGTTAYIQTCTTPYSQKCTLIIAVDVSNPHQPQQLATVDITSYWYITNSIVRVADGLLYVAYTARYTTCCSFSTLDMFDVRNPTNIVRVGTVSLTLPDVLAGIHGLDVVGHTVYVNIGGILRVLDVRDPSSPLLLGEATINVNTIQVQNDLLYSAAFTSTAILDVHSPTAITVTGQLEAPDTISQLHVFADRAYALTQQAGVLILDVSDAANPRQVGVYRP